LLSFSVSRVSGLAISNSPDAPKKIEFSIQLDAGKHVDLKIALAAKRDDMERKKGKGAGRQTETLTGDKPNCDFSWWPNGYERRKLLDNMFVVLLVYNPMDADQSSDAAPVRFRLPAGVALARNKVSPIGADGSSAIHRNRACKQC